MRSLAFANLWHRKVRSALAGLAVAIGVAMLVTMLALSHGTLSEVANRVKSIDAELVVMPPRSSVIYSQGAALSNKYIAEISAATVDSCAVVRRVIPVFRSVIHDMAGQQQAVFGVEPSDFDAFCGSRKIIRGQVFPHADEFRQALMPLRKDSGAYDPDTVPAEAVAGACEMVIDQRLARAGGYKVGDTVEFLGSEFTVCGIVEPGLAGRVFVPIDVLRHIEGGGLARSSAFFVQIREGVSTQDAAGAIKAATHLQVEPLDDYDQMLFNSFRSIYVYINIASSIVLLVSFLFIMVTIYTMVLERRREIGVLRAMGAGDGYIMGQTVLEAVTISVMGTAVGIALAFLAKWLIEHYRPLLTVDVQGKWLVLAWVVGLSGGLISALYPGYRALCADPVECLTYE